MAAGLVLLTALGLYFTAPQWVAWANIPLPAWVRWLGLALGYANLPLLWWIEATLGKNFNTTLHLREGHTLVTGGPYRWARHPMYTSLFVFTLAVLLASANWLVGLPGLIGLTGIVVNRIDAEESLMMERFGADHARPPHANRRSQTRRAVWRRIPRVHEPHRAFPTPPESLTRFPVSFTAQTRQVLETCRV